MFTRPVRFGVGLLLCATSCIAFYGCRDHLPSAAFSFSHVGQVISLAFSPDGNYLAAGSKGVSRQPVEFWQGEVIVWELDTGKKTSSLRTTSRIRSLAFAPTGERLAVGCGNTNIHSKDFRGYTEKAGEIIVCEFPSLREKAKVKDGSGIFSILFSPDGKSLASTSYVNLHVVDKELPWGVRGCARSRLLGRFLKDFLSSRTAS